MIIATLKQHEREAMREIAGQAASFEELTLEDMCILGHLSLRLLHSVLLDEERKMNDPT